PPSEVRISLPSGRTAERAATRCAYPVRLDARMRITGAPNVSTCPIPLDVPATLPSAVSVLEPPSAKCNARVGGTPLYVTVLPFHGSAATSTCGRLPSPFCVLLRKRSNQAFVSVA